MYAMISVNHKTFLLRHCRCHKKLECLSTTSLMSKASASQCRTLAVGYFPKLKILDYVVKTGSLEYAQVLIRSV